jgi:ribosomal protein L21E
MFKVGDLVRIRISEKTDAPSFVRSFNGRVGRIVALDGFEYDIEFLDDGESAKPIWTKADLVLEPNGVERMIECLK